MSNPGNNRKGNRVSIVSFIICVLCALGIAFMAITPESYSLSAGDIAPKDIMSPREVTDEITTDENKQKARDSVSPVYSMDSSMTLAAEEGLAKYFDAVDTVCQRAEDMVQQKQADYEKEREKEQNSIQAALNEGQAPLAATLEAKKFDYNDLTNEDLDTLISLLPTEVADHVVSSNIFDMLYADKEDLQTAREASITIVSASMKEGIRETEFEAKKSEVRDLLDDKINTTETTTIAWLGVDAYLQANSKLDEAATEEERKKAEEAVVPSVYKKGQAIVREGSVITEREIEVLSTLGMLAGGVNVRMYLGAFLCILIGAAACASYAKFYNARLLYDGKIVLLCGIVMLLQLAVTAVLIKIDMKLIPIVFVPLVLSLCIDSVTASILSMISISMSAYIMACSGIEPINSFSYLLIGFVASPVAAISVDMFKNRTGIMLAGVIAGLSAGVVSTIMGLQGGANSMVMLSNATYYLASGLTSAIMCIGTMPIFESVFQVLTPMKLMELCNSTNHLLKKLALEAPGTYHHSTMVANLAEAAAEAIGANALLARAGGYYHDVGKLKAPIYYKENQNIENPHDNLSPEESARIIAMHTLDGGKMIRDARLPETIALIAEQHHGTYLMGYFYQMGLEKYGAVDESNYRHLGGLPTSREAAIVMLADAVEAAVRADSTDYLNTISSLIMNRLEDGQLNQAPLTLVDLERIASAFDGVLRGAYHNRIKYPKITRPEPTRALQGQGSNE